MFIEIESTPNPETLKFLPGRVLLKTGGSLDLPNIDIATEKSPLAAALFEIAHVQAVFIGYDFISISKAQNVEWDQIKPQILGVMLERLLDGTPIYHMPPQQNTTQDEMENDDADSEIIAQIKELLERRVRPAVANDGGDIVFHGFRDGIVYLTMQGACAGCPSSTATLKMGIENMLRHYIPEVIEVRATG